MKRFIYVALSLLSLILLSPAPLAEECKEELTVSYYVGDELVTDKTCFVGEMISPVNISSIDGYAITAWRTATGEVYNFDTPAYESLSLYAQLTLLPTIASVEDISFIYDGESRPLEPSSVYHPLEREGGHYTFYWYKNSEPLGEGSSLELSSVSDSGEYSLKIGFHIGEESSYILYDGITVDIKPKEVTVPQIEPISYTGELVTPAVLESPLYTFEQVYVRNIGEYFLKLTLCDSENYRWSEGVGESIFVKFAVTEPVAVPDIDATHKEGGDEHILTFGTVLFLLALVFASGALIMMIIGKRNAVSLADPTPAEPKREPAPKDSDSNFCEEAEDCSLGSFVSDKHYNTLSEINSTRADLLISDSMAKNMIKKADEYFYVSGVKRAQLSLGEISDAFEEDDTVDIYSLERRGLISSSIGHVTVTEEGTLNKPLKIYANDITPTAVKMIVLSGGEAFRCHTKKR